jgi:uncharacterized protein YgbK (DUF1537 family)
VPALVALDDDPTGVQAMEHVSVALAWDAEAVAIGGEAGSRALHIVTNSRALDSGGARRVTAEAATAVSSPWPSTPIILRGDSTLRAHLLPEYDALRRTIHRDSTPPLVLVPALPAAGRITKGGVHLLSQGGTEVPLHETEYSQDPRFGYKNARLLSWAEERSQGFFDASRGIELSLRQIRDEGPDAISNSLADLASRKDPAVLAPDAVSMEDLQIIAEGLRSSWIQGITSVLRSGPTLAGVLSGSIASGLVDMPRCGRGMLVVCGSFVSGTTRQLAALTEHYPDVLVEVDPLALASTDARQSVIESATDRSVSLLQQRGLAVVATARNRVDLKTAQRASLVTDGLAEITRNLHGEFDILMTKGGITAAAVVRGGVGARVARVIGPVAGGVSLWQPHMESAAHMRIIVVPGNVGGNNLLLDLVHGVTG